MVHFCSYDDFGGTLESEEIDTVSESQNRYWFLVEFQIWYDLLIDMSEGLLVFISKRLDQIPFYIVCYENKTK
jgi:hypothetical protein